MPLWSAATYAGLVSVPGTWPSAPPPGPPLPPAGRTPGWLLVLVVTVGLVLQATIATTAVRALWPAGAFGAPTPTSSVRGSAPPSAQRSLPAQPMAPDAPIPDGPPAPMTGSPLYQMAWKRDSGSTVCPNLSVKRPPLPAGQVLAYAKDVVDCLMALNQPAAAAAGLTINRPGVKTYAGRTMTPCGPIVDGMMAVYCSLNHTIYVSTVADDTSDGYRGARLGYLWVIAHEFAHHLQSAADLFDAGAPASRLEATRRAELQANCAAGVFFGTVWSQVDGDAESYQQLVTALFITYAYETAGSDSHGTPGSVLLWFNRGFKHEYATYARCNTFDAPAGEVR